MKQQAYFWLRLLGMAFALIVPVTASQAANPGSEDIQRMCLLFVCNCNCGTQINPCDESQCPTAQAFRGEIEQMLRDGKTKEQIRDYYVAQFGESILRAPLKTGFSLTAWTLPFAGLALGGAGVWLLIRRRISNSSLQLAGAGELLSGPAGAGNAVDSELYAEMIERERRKYL